jgi:glycosyltransferase involved in cell wall biosynthesis
MGGPREALVSASWTFEPKSRYTMSFPYRQIVFLYGGRSQEPINRSQQLARYFGEVAPVLYVSYGSLRYWLDGEWRYSAWEPLSRHPSISILATPSSICLGRRSAVAGLLNGLWVSWRLKRWLVKARLREDEVLLFVYSPVAAPVLDRFPSAPVHYDCADDHENWFNASPRMSKLNRSYEQRVVRCARTITATSQLLLRKMQRDHDRVYLVPNGVDCAHFAAAQNSVPGELTALPRPICGFIGMTADYVDWDLVEQLARAQVGSLVFVGPERSSQPRFQSHTNVHLLGPRRYEELPRYLHAFDVCLIPANRQRAALAANPGKLYQYLASGKPIVGTDLPELQPYQDVIDLAGNSEEFIDKVRKALTTPNGLTQQRLQAAHAASWELRARAILDIIRNNHASPRMCEANHGSKC